MLFADLLPFAVSLTPLRGLYMEITMSITNNVISVREKEAARLLGVSYAIIKKWRYQGRGPDYSRLYGRLVLYTLQALKEFVDRNAVTVTPPEPPEA